MTILRKINSKSFLIYRLIIYVFIFFFIFSIDSCSMNTSMEQKQPEFEYNNSLQFITALESCIKWQEKDRTKWQLVPHEIIIAQAIIESDYGTSRFAIEGNNLFGIRTYDLNMPHIKPYNNEESKFGLKVYNTMCDSVDDYLKVLNNSFAFEDFRELRYKMIKQGNINVFKLVDTLHRYASNPNYTTLIKEKIKSLKEEIYGKKELDELNESYNQSLQNKKERDEKK